MRRSFPASLVLFGALAVPLSVSAQNKARNARPARPAPPAAAKPAPAPSAPATEPAKEPGGAATTADAPSASGDTSGDELGAPPPKTAPESAAMRPSPLTPEPGEFPAGAPKPAPVAYDKLLADIAALRSRVAALSTTLFSSKLRVVIELDGDEARVASFRITLDDGIVYAAPERFTADEPLVVYEHAVAPGHHVVGVEVERYDGRNRQYRTFQTSKFSVVVPESRKLETSVRVEDDSDMAEDFPDDEDGQYDLRVRLRAAVVD